MTRILTYKKPICFILLVLVMIAISVAFILSLPGEGDYQVYRDFALIIAVSCVLIIGATLFLIFFTGRKLETVFVFAYILLGIVYNFIFPPFSPPDEYGHWRQATRYTNYLFYPEEENKYFFDPQRFGMPGVIAHQNNKKAYRVIMETLFVPDDSEAMIQETIVEYFFPPQYAAPAIGLTLGKILPVSKYMEHYMGRLFNLIFTAVLLYYAIKIIPKYKASVIVISLLPMFLHLSASYSYDAYVNAMSMLLMALILREIYSRDKLKTSRYALIIIIAVLLAPAKFVYSLLVFLILLIPKSNFKSKADYYIKSLGAIGAVFGFAAIGYLVSAVLTPVQETNWEGAQNYTISFIFSNPIQTLRIFFYTTTIQMGFLIQTAFGSYLSGVSMVVDYYIIVGFMLLFVLTCFSRDSEPEMEDIGGEVRLRLMSLFVIIAVYLAILFAFFTGWTSDHREIIQGVQGRYFIPLMLPVAIVFSNKMIGFKTNLDKFFLASSAMLNVPVVYDVVGKTIWLT